jgi:hypothetical protein
MQYSESSGARESRARRAAARIGLKAEKSRWRRDSIDNRGGFMLVDPYRNHVVMSVRFDMSAVEVIKYCAERE